MTPADHASGAASAAPEHLERPVPQGWRRYRADLHVHTCLSPCAEPEMTPESIVAAARARGLAIVAICDHDTAGSCALACRQTDGELCVIAGIEITIEEEKHLLGWFGSPAAAEAVAQRIVGVVGDRPTLVDAVDVIHANGGLAIAAHVDRPSSGILGRGGRIPRGAGLDALELSRTALGSQMRVTLAALGVALTTGSDSHCLDDIGTCATFLEVPALSFDELAMAVRGLQGRRCWLA